MVHSHRYVVVFAVLLVCLFTGGFAFGKSKPKTKTPPEPPAVKTDSEGPKRVTTFAESAEPNWTTDPVSQFVYYAVLEGLHVDGVSGRDLALIIPLKISTKRPDYTASFIYACPICEPALEAMREYGARPGFLGFNAPAPDTFGPGLDEHTREQLGSPAIAQRQEAMQRLIGNWVRARLDLMRASEAERAAWRTKFEAARERGLEKLKTYQEKKTFSDAYAEWTHCPACDGAVEGCQAEKPAPSADNTGAPQK